MVWEQEVEVIVMLTSVVEQGKTKCEIYWPQSRFKAVVFEGLLTAFSSLHFFVVANES